jgi:small neutral amino acid transporter SnatA (MarC family)
MTIITLLLLLNPAALALIWLSYQQPMARRELIDVATRVALLSSLALCGGVLVAAPVLDVLEISDSTYRIVAGTLVILGASQAFLGFGLRHASATRVWLIAAAAIWLISPPAIAAASAISVDDGVVVGLAVALPSVVITVVLSTVWVDRVGERYQVVLGLLRRLLAAGAVFGGVELIWQGVLSI